MNKAPRHKKPRSSPAGGKAAKIVMTKPTQVAAEAHFASAVAPAAAAPAAAVAKPEIKRNQGLIESKTADGVSLGLSLLESLRETRADYEAVFKEIAIKSILSG